MTTHQAERASITDLESQVYALVECGKFGDALDAIRQFSEAVINNQRSVGKVFASADLDKLCRYIGKIAASKAGIGSLCPLERKGTVILATELVNAGGHVELIKDIIRLKLFDAPISILLTDILDRAQEDIITNFSVTYGVTIEVAKVCSTNDRLMWLFDRLRSSVPTTLVLLTYNQDGVGIAAASSYVAGKVVFIHHADHHLCLGVTCEDFIHIDPHNIGFFHCKNELGIKNNYYWPLTINLGSLEPRSDQFLSEGHLVTCSSGRPDKFNASYYLYDYFKLIPKLLAATSGRHIHIGSLTADMEAGLQHALMAEGVDPARFTNIPWVPSVARALIEYHVDLYISSFPLGGGKATLEAMAAGTPLLMHQSYRSRFHGGGDLAYPDAWLWRTEADLLDMASNISVDDLMRHSLLARAHYGKYHSDKSLINATDFSKIQDIDAVPKLRQYTADDLQIFLDETAEINAIDSVAANKLQSQLIEREQQINAYKLQAEKFDALLRTANAQIVNLNQTLTIHAHEIAVLRRSTSWQITKPLRFISRRVSRLKLVLLVKRAYRKLTINLDKLPESFDRDAYLKLNPDVAEAGFDPAIHYLLDGCRESRAYTLPEMDIGSEYGKLPDNFNRDLYLKLYPEVAAAGMDPATHYLLYGYHEDRIYMLPEMDLCGVYDFKADRETILVVSHDASRTGAPVLSLNLVKALAEHHNVVALLLGGGSLSDAFKLSGAAVIESFCLRRNPVLANAIVGQLCASFNFKFALVNSIESRVVLPALGKFFVPAISLIHEFASYTRPRDAFRDAIFWSGEVVFSANITMENAFAEYPDLSERAAHILPQGRCLLPTEFSEGQRQIESEHIHRLIRPKGLAENTVIVLGAGSVQLRKGIDLFIECATRVIRAPDGIRCRFIWIGNGYDPENDIGYSVYLADQVRRAGLQEHILFINETTAIETAYEEADLLLLSSRLDPLPNVAIDAMAYGMPVLCFDKTTGIADFLIHSGLRDHCVAQYLDSSDMAQKILALAASQLLREDVGEQCRVASISYFNMKKYVTRLEVLAQGICNRTRQEQVDTKTILDAGLFRQDFSCPQHQQVHSIEDEVRLYVRAWASGINRRKPFPGFHPGIYQEQHGLATHGTDPFADYLREAHPEGSWNYPVIVAPEVMVDNLPENHRIALHLHIYYPELLDEIITQLAYNRICPDLFVSITDENTRQLIVSELINYKGKVVDIQLVPNRGRDIGPLLTAFGQGILANYDFIGHIHTKKTVDVKDPSMGETWRQFLLENLLGSESRPMADTILTHMNNDVSIGMIFPDDPYIVGWGTNLAFAKPLAARMGLETLPEHFIFPVGTMFWAKASALVPLLNLNLGWDDYPEEPLPYDGTSLHALERLFPLTLSLNNLHYATTNVIGLTR